jgi:hypothetical protein
MIGETAVPSRQRRFDRRTRRIVLTVHIVTSTKPRAA